MSEATAPAMAQPIQQNLIFVQYNQKSDKSPRLNSVLGAFNTLIGRELKRKQDEAARAKLTEEQRQTYDMGAWTSYSEFFSEKGIPGMPEKGGFMAECKLISDSIKGLNDNVVSGLSIKTFTKKLKDVGEFREWQTVFEEVYETHKNAPSNKYAHLLEG